MVTHRYKVVRRVGSKKILGIYQGSNAYFPKSHFSKSKKFKYNSVRRLGKTWYSPKRKQSTRKTYRTSKRRFGFW